MVDGERKFLSQYLITRQPVLRLSAANRLLEMAILLAEARGFVLSFAVTDASGLLIAFARMDGAAPVTVDVALAKARSAALLRGPSRGFEDMVNGGAPAMLSTPGITPLRGGVPVMVAGEVCGAFGVSGSSGENDEAIATDIAAEFSEEIIGAAEV